MTSRVKAIGLWIWYIWVDDNYADQPWSFIEDLNIESDWIGAHARVHEGARLDIVSSEGEGDFCDRVDMREEIGNDMHLGNALQLDFTAILAPLFVGEVAIDGTVHVS